MAKTIWSYPVKYIYGWSQAYGGWHSGEDRTVTDKRKDILATVNGKTIGIVGTTGKSTGIHLHIGKWKLGVSFNPKGGGKLFKSAVVTQIDRVGASDNGKFVRIQGDGYSWVYLHLASIPSTLKVGQKLVATYPIVVTVNVAALRVRDKPTTASKTVTVKYYKQKITVVAKVKGQSVNGDPYWYKTSGGNYVYQKGVK